MPSNNTDIIRWNPNAPGSQKIDCSPFKSLNQAVMVCMDNKVDIKEVERWSLNEDMRDKYLRFRKLLPEKTED